MGELRNSIVELQKQIVSASKKGDELAKVLDEVDQRASKHYERLMGGFDSLWQYLDSKFEGKDQKLSDNLRDKLSMHADSEVLTFIKGLDSTADDVIKAIGEYTSIKDKMPAEYQRIDTLIGAIRDNIAKKRAKLFQSKKYKTKLIGYEKAVDELAKAIEDRRKAFKDLATWPSANSANKLRVKVTMTLKEIDDLAAHSVKSQWEEMKKAVKANTFVSREWRENGDLKQAFEMMKKWAAEADPMDQEVIALDPSIAKVLKNVYIQSASKVVAKAPKGTFMAKRPMELKDVKWEKGADFKKMLKKTVTVRGEIVSGGQGEFVNDMKLTAADADSAKLA